MNGFERSSKPIVGVVSVLLAAILAACGGGGGSSTSADAPPSGASTAPASGGTPVIAPTVLWTDPVNESAGIVMPDKKISATFSQSIKSATIVSPATAFTLVDTRTGANVPGTVSLNDSGSVATFAPATNLAPNTRYSAAISTAVRDTAGVALASDATWSFTTAAVTAVRPYQDEMNLATNTKVVASFGRAMDPASITAPNASAVTVTNASSGGVVAGTVSLDAGNSNVMFTPASALAPNTKYTVTISTAARYASGAPLATGFSWSFTTGSSVDTKPWTVNVIDPMHSDMAVALDKTVSASFTKPMDPTSFTQSSITLAGADGTPVAGTASYSFETNTVSFKPAGTLASATQYSVAISNTLLDLTGNMSATDCDSNNCVWRFRTR